MKKLTKVLVLLLIVVAVFSLTACNKEVDDSLKSVTLLIVDLEGVELANYERETNKAFVVEFFLELQKEENSTFAFTSTSSTFGAFINTITVSVNEENWGSVGLFPLAANNEFCAFYHNIDDAKYIYYDMGTKKHNDIDFFSSGTGISDTPLIDGATYMFAMDSY